MAMRDMAMRDSYIERDLYNDRHLGHLSNVREDSIQEERIDYMDQPYHEYRFRIMKDAPPNEQRRQLEYARLEIRAMAQEIRERERNDIRVAKRVEVMLRGLTLSDEAYHIIRRELEHGYDRYRDERLRHREETYLKHMMDTMQREIQAKEIRVKPERKDFLGEEEMKL
jgi:hypothetical protein